MGAFQKNISFSTFFREYVVFRGVMFQTAHTWMFSPEGAFVCSFRNWISPDQTNPLTWVDGTFWPSILQEIGRRLGSYKVGPYQLEAVL